MDTIETNKLMAEFMGLSYCTKYLYEGWYKNHEHNHRICDFSGLKYNTSWDWLMLVLEKIESLGYWFELRSFNNGYRVFIGSNEDFEHKNHPIASVFDADKKQAIYRACIVFINDYNSKIINR